MVDAQPLLRAGLAASINAQPDMRVSGEAGDPAAAVSSFIEHQPDMVITEIALPGRSGGEFIKDLLAIDPDLPILVFTALDERLFASRMLKLGARGFLMKTAPVSRVVEAARQLLAGDIFVSETLSRQLIGSLVGAKPAASSSPASRLNDREFEVFRLFGEGCDTWDVARRLALSHKTVDVHAASIRRKLAISSPSALVHFATRWLLGEAQFRKPLRAARDRS
jgi:DNA-binding NarL/FixJ family response regulator